ncbi:MAG: trigger factor [Solobacterium sp.]|nr:trigger factor [Solobacterium sp.]
MANWTLTEKAKGEMTVKIDGDAWKKAVNKAFNRIAKEVSIPGFRKGNVPKAMIEKRIPRSAVYEQAIDDNIQNWFQSALEECGIRPIAQADSNLKSVSEDGVELAFTVKVEPEAELKDLSDVKYEVKLEEVTDKDIENEINRIRERYAENEEVEGPAEEGDTVDINYVGKKDGVPFEGGSANDYKLKLGSHTFIPGFEEGLIGAVKGEEKELTLKFPEDYHSADLAGADVVFEVTVNDVTRQVLPEVNEEFVEDQNIPNVDTVEQFREHIRTRLTDTAKRNAEAAAENDMMEAFAAAVDVEVPEEMIEEEANSQVQQQATQLQQYGMSLSGYLQMLGQTAEQFKESFREQAEKTNRVRLGLKALAKREGFVASDEELEKKFQEIADMYNMAVDQVKQYVQRETLRQDLANEKAIEFLKGNRSE